MNTSEVRINVRLIGSDASYFQELLKRKGGSVSELLREALREYGGRRVLSKPAPAQLLAGFVASGEGPEDLSLDYKRYLTEVTHLLVARVGVHQALDFMDAVAQGACTVWPLSDEAATRMAYLMRRNSNLPMDLADASLVVLAEQSNEGRILSTDRRDFDGCRWKNTPPFTNMLFKA